MQKAVRVISTVAVLMSATFLAVDFAFMHICPAKRGMGLYICTQVLGQLSLAFLLARRVIVLHH